MTRELRALFARFACRGVPVRARWPVVAGLMLCALPLLIGCADMVGVVDRASPAADSHPTSTEPASGNTVSFTLKTIPHNGGLAFVGVGGGIDGVVNPELRVDTGDQVKITLINGEPSEHDIAIPELGVWSAHILGAGAQTSVTFTPQRQGEFTYLCTLFYAPCRATVYRGWKANS